MKGKKTVVFLAALFLMSSLTLKAYAQPHVHFPSPEDTTASKESVKELEVFYDKLDDALAKKDLDTLMSFYANDYFHQGITKDIIKNLWSNLFNNFDRINSVHFFSSMNVQGTEALIVCTGDLMGVPKDSKEKQNVVIDRWTNQNHWLSKKDGKWQIVGGATHWLSEARVLPKGAVKYQIEFHPLF